MEDPVGQLIRRALARRAPPKLGPTLTADVLRRLAARHPPAVAGRRTARRWLAVPWLVAAGASAAVLAHLEWSSEARAVTWGLALGLVPLTYSATLWPQPARVLLALCGGPLVGDARDEPKVVVPRPPSRRRGQRPA